jgi:hypothetical protein
MWSKMMSQSAPDPHVPVKGTLYEQQSKRIDHLEEISCRSPVCARAWRI